VAPCASTAARTPSAIRSPSLDREGDRDEQHGDAGDQTGDLDEEVGCLSGALVDVLLEAGCGAVGEGGDGEYDGDREDADEQAQQVGGTVDAGGEQWLVPRDPVDAGAAGGVCRFVRSFGGFVRVFACGCVRAFVGAFFVGAFVGAFGRGVCCFARGCVQGLVSGVVRRFLFPLGGAGTLTRNGRVRVRLGLRGARRLRRLHALLLRRLCLFLISYHQSPPA
jgi:hypothetical protein